ncbi:MAG: helix-turn-helix domain-containing protein [Desulfomonilaceae bacterium]
MEPLLKSGEVARQLGITSKTLRLWCEQGTAPDHIRTPGGHIRFRPRDIRLWIQKNAQNPGQDAA